MELTGEGANRAARRLAERKLEKELTIITILVREVDGEKVYQWGGNTQVWFSPPLPSMEIAFKYPLTHGLAVWTPDK